LFERALKENCIASTASNLLKEYHHVAIFSTGIGSLDDILKGGVFSSELTEIFGFSGSGKTSFCVKLSAQLLIKSKKKSVIYIDTTNCFTYGRLIGYINACVNIKLRLQILNLKRLNK